MRLKAVRPLSVSISLASGLFPPTLRRSLLAPVSVSLIGIASMPKANPHSPFETIVVLYHRTKAIRHPFFEPVGMRLEGSAAMALDENASEGVSTVSLQ